MQEVINELRHAAINNREENPEKFNPVLELEKRNRVAALEMYQYREWNAGDVYAPHDLSWAENSKWRVKKPPEHDVFDVLGINPLHEYKVTQSLLVSQGGKKYILT